MFEYCRHGLQKGRKHFFYGGAEGIAELLKAKLTEQFPNLIVAGTYCPPFRKLTDEEEEDVKRRIEESGAEMVWVGLGAPKQDIWMAEHVGKINVPLMVAVGAAFNYLTGLQSRAPLWVQKIGMEWLYRMLTQGRRVIFRNAKSLPFLVWNFSKHTIARRLGL